MLGEVLYQYIEYKKYEYEFKYKLRELLWH